jgi:hypothetical protein
MGFAFKPPFRLMTPTDRKESPCPSSSASRSSALSGVVSRYAIDTVIERRSDAVFPWATFTVNVSGCLRPGSSSRRSSTAIELPPGFGRAS